MLNYNSNFSCGKPIFTYLEDVFVTFNEMSLIKSSSKRLSLPPPDIFISCPGWWTGGMTAASSAAPAQPSAQWMPSISRRRVAGCVAWRCASERMSPVPARGAACAPKSVRRTLSALSATRITVSPDLAGCRSFETRRARQPAFAPHAGQAGGGADQPDDGPGA